MQKKLQHVQQCTRGGVLANCLITHMKYIGFKNFPNLKGYVGFTKLTIRVRIKANDNNQHIHMVKVRVNIFSFIQYLPYRYKSVSVG